MSRDKHLTKDPLDRVIVPGMAHFPGGGPEGKYCVDCIHLVPGRPDKRGRFKKETCGMYQAQYHFNVPEISIGPSNRSCRYFQEKVAKSN